MTALEAIALPFGYSDDICRLPSLVAPTYHVFVCSLYPQYPANSRLPRWRLGHPRTGRKGQWDKMVRESHFLAKLSNFQIRRNVNLGQNGTVVGIFPTEAPNSLRRSASLRYLHRIPCAVTESLQPNSIARPLNTLADSQRISQALRVTAERS